MERTALLELYDYNRWANRRALDAASRVPPEDFIREVGGSFGSLRNTLAHVYGTEWVWLERCRGTSPPSLPAASEFPDAAAIRSKWETVEGERRRFLEALDPARLAESLTYTNFRGERWTYTLERILLHVVNHSTYHRGQVATILRQLGATPLSTDLLQYYDEK
jgi:uncharacterized damage-inducible protein DinB